MKNVEREKQIEGGIGFDTGKAERGREEQVGWWTNTALGQVNQCSWVGELVDGWQTGCLID